jgi:uncharacterized protein
MHLVGRVKAIYRYPVKSMAGESLAAAVLRWSGIDGDRQYAFYRVANTTRFPWLTGRDVADLVTYPARYIEPDDPRHSPVRVTIDVDEYDVGDSSLRRRLSEAAGEKVRLIQVGRGTFDSMPLSVMTTGTLARLGARLDAPGGNAPVDPRRFRPNILVEVPESENTRESDWVGGTLVFGEGPDAPGVQANLPIDRCVMITIDPDTAVREPALLRRVIEDFGNEIGIRGATASIGTIRVGDPVYLQRGTQR